MCSLCFSDEGAPQQRRLAAQARAQAPLGQRGGRYGQRVAGGQRARGGGGGERAVLFASDVPLFGAEVLCPQAKLN